MRDPTTLFVPFFLEIASIQLLGGHQRGYEQQGRETAEHRHSGDPTLRLQKQIQCTAPVLRADRPVLQHRPVQTVRGHVLRAAPSDTQHRPAGEADLPDAGEGNPVGMGEGETEILLLAKNVTFKPALFSGNPGVRIVCRIRADRPPERRHQPRQQAAEVDQKRGEQPVHSVGADLLGLGFLFPFLSVVFVLDRLQW